MRKLADAIRAGKVPCLSGSADRSMTLFILINRSDKNAETPSVANLVETLDDQTKSTKKNKIRQEYQAFEGTREEASIEHGGIGGATPASSDD